MSKVSGSCLGIMDVVQRNGRVHDPAGVINSVSTFWHGVKVDRPPEVTPVQRACAYVERRSELLNVADRQAVTLR